MYFSRDVIVVQVDDGRTSGMVNMIRARVRQPEDHLDRQLVVPHIAAVLHSFPLRVNILRQLRVRAQAEFRRILEVRGDARHPLDRIATESLQPRRDIFRSVVFFPR